MILRIIMKLRLSLCRRACAYTDMLTPRLTTEQVIALFDDITQRHRQALDLERTIEDPRYRAMAAECTQMLNDSRILLAVELENRGWCTGLYMTRG